MLLALTQAVQVVPTNAWIATSLVSWAVLGLIVGAIAKAIHPGPDPGGIVGTMVIGLVGAVLGGSIGSLIGIGGVAGFDLKSLGLAVLGALILLLVFRLIRKFKSNETAPTDQAQHGP